MIDHHSLLEVKGLTVPLPAGSDRPFAVENVSFDIKPGEVLCIVGESGSGKSMSANAIMGLLPPELARNMTGVVAFQGSDLIGLSDSDVRTLRGRKIAMIFQEPLSALNPLMTVGAQIVETMLVHGISDAIENKKRALHLMEYVGLPRPNVMFDEFPFRLSGGQRQRIMIAMALMHEPALLIADEPTTALDVTTQAQILKLIADIQRDKGMGVMFITHDFGVVAEIAHRVVVMEKGLVVEIGDVDQILNSPRHPYTQHLIAAVPRMVEDNALPEIKSEPVLHVQSLSKTYLTGGGLFQKKKEVNAVSGVSFSIARGETLGVVGESGSGKSTIGKLLLKLIPATSGSLIYEGKDITDLKESEFRPLRRKIQMIFQDPFSALNPRHNIGRIISDGMGAKGISASDARKRCVEILKLVDLDASAISRFPSQFSGGQRQRIGIARALALDPTVLVADESVSALDVSVQAQVLALLVSLQQKLGIAIIFITHDLRVAAQICNRVIVMHQGKVVDQGAPGEIFASSAHPYTRRLVDSIPGKKWDASRSTVEV